MLTADGMIWMLFLACSFASFVTKGMERRFFIAAGILCLVVSVFIATSS